MLNNPNVKVAPEWWAIYFDETRYWNIDAADKPFIDRFIGVYAFNRSVYTYCCELTPSYFLVFIYNDIHFNYEALDALGEDAAQAKREELYSKYIDESSGESCYMHVRSVEAVPAERKHAYGPVDLDEDDPEDDGEKEVVEHFRGNYPF